MRVLLADDQPKVCSALRLLLGQQPGIEVVGETAGKDSARSWRPSLTRRIAVGKQCWLDLREMVRANARLKSYAFDLSPWSVHCELMR